MGAPHKRERLLCRDIFRMHGSFVILCLVTPTSDFCFFVSGICRYGTTVYVMPPTKILHTTLMHNEAEKLRHAVQATNHPLVIVVPKDFEDVTRPQQMLRDAGLWFL